MSKVVKRIWVRKDQEGVSPVIATILMVAITVVLAAVLYVMVSDFDDRPDIQTTGTIEEVKIRSGESVEIVFGTFSGDMVPIENKLILQDSNGTRLVLTWPYPPDSDNFDMESSQAGVTAIYRDYNPVGNEINPGDSVIIDGLQPNTNYEIKMVDIAGSEVGLSGDSDFTTPS